VGYLASCAERSSQEDALLRKQIEGIIRACWSSRTRNGARAVQSESRDLVNNQIPCLQLPNGNLKIG
jgi:hypothetical protein